MKFLNLGALFDNIFTEEVDLAIIAIDCILETAVLSLEVGQRAVSCELALKHRAKDADHKAPLNGKH